jgi:hypothetical protein
MPTANYGQLKTQVAAYMQRGDLTSMIPDFIESATKRFSDQLRTPEMEAVSTTTLAGEWTALPTGFRAMRLLEAGGHVLEYRTPWQLQKLIEASYVLTTPVYTIQDMQFRVYPFPSSTVVELTFYQEIPALVDDADTNWLLDKRPDVYRQAALMEGWMFVHDDQRYTMAAQFVDKYIAEANRAARNILIGASPLAITPG